MKSCYIPSNKNIIYVPECVKHLSSFNCAKERECCLSRPISSSNAWGEGQWGIGLVRKRERWCSNRFGASTDSVSYPGYQRAAIIFNSVTERQFRKAVEKILVGGQNIVSSRWLEESLGTLLSEQCCVAVLRLCWLRVKCVRF